MKLSIGYLGLLNLIFIAFKLAHIINWSWWWVLAPLWIPTGLTLTALGVILILLFWKYYADCH